MIDGQPAGSELAGLFTHSGDHIWEYTLQAPITQLSAGELSVSITDKQGNISSQRRQLSIVPPLPSPTLQIAMLVQTPSESGATVEFAYAINGDQSQVAEVFFQLDQQPEVVDADQAGVFTFVDVRPGQHTISGFLVGADSLVIDGSQESIAFEVMQVIGQDPEYLARYVRFVAESEVNGKPWTSLAEINVLDAAGNTLDRSNWSVMASSQELVGEDGAAANAIDGNPLSVWHTDWATHAGDSNDPAHPHELIIDLGATHELSGFRFLPRQDHINGRVNAYRLYVSADGVDWGSPVAQERFVNDVTPKTVFFDAQD